jgi:hypothetical protein
MFADPKTTEVSEISPAEEHVIIESISDACWSEFAQHPLVAILLAEGRIVFGAETTQAITRYMAKEFPGRQYVRVINKHRLAVES